MIKIINGKKYDTETAKHLGNYWNYLGTNDFRHLNEDLYIKKTGEYFIHGCGGARTRYAKACGNCWGGGEAIVPLTINEAKEWVEAHLTGEEYEAIFGEVEE